jgi:DNA-cytosine methyltransferase
MKVLSLFDGISACHLALRRAGFEVSTYYTSESVKYAAPISEHNYPDANRICDVTKHSEWDIDWANIDIVTGGFPCQAWSVAGNQMGDKDERGILFWVMLDIMKKVLSANPKAFFLMENVKMKGEFEQYITRHTEQALGQVEKHLINSALVSAQNRQRYYWTNIKGIEQPEDKGLVLADIVESGEVDREKSLTVTTRVAGGTAKRYLEKSMHQMVIDKPVRVLDINCGGQGNRVYSTIGKSICLSASSSGKAGAGNMLIEQSKFLVGRMVGRKINPETGKRDDYNSELKAEQRIEPRLDEKCGTLTTVQKDNLLISGATWRKLTPLECERLQTFPDGWTLVEDENGKQMVSNSQRYKALGNAWTVDVIAHIFSFMCKSTPELVTLEGGLFIPRGTQLTLEFYEELNKVAVA